MFEQSISLKNINDVYDFVMAVQSINCDIDLSTEHRRYIVDAKSIMGVFSLDLSQPLILRAYTDDQEMIGCLVDAIKDIGR